MVEGKLHQGMPCPVCRVDLVIANRQNVEIDYCPQCRGVWLDRGELDKILERSGPPPDRGFQRNEHQDDRRRSRDYGDDEQQGRGSWLGDLFNFD